MVVFIDKLKVLSSIGWYEQEREMGVELFISIRIELNSSVFNDKLNYTIDYAEIARLAFEISKQPVQLIETYIHNLKESIIANYNQAQKIKSIFIRVEKPQIFQSNLQYEGVGVETLYIL